MKRTVPIRRPSPHFTFNLDLSGTRVQVRLDWLTRFGFYVATITDLESEETLIAGAGLHPGMNLLQDTAMESGKLYLEGSPATPSNLGEANSLIWETDE